MTSLACGRVQLSQVQNEACQPERGKLPPGFLTRHIGSWCTACEGLCVSIVLVPSRHADL